MLETVVFLSGAVLMSLEMVGSRLLAPVFGSSIYVWGSLIVVVMAALTLGYYSGGRWADKYPQIKVLGFILASSGIYIGFLPLWAGSINNVFGMMEPRIGSLIVATAFFFVPSVLLATISPYGIKLTSRSLTTIGNTAGYIAAFSSAGSIFGTMLTAFFLIPVIGVRNIIHSLGIILLLLSLIVFLSIKRSLRSNSVTGNQSSLQLLNLMLGIVLPGSMIMIGWLMIAPVKIIPQSNYETLYERDSLYHHVKVEESGTGRILSFDNTMQSAMDIKKPLQMSFPYTSFLHLGVVAHPEPSRVLFIGLGGGSAINKFLHDYNSLKVVDVVDIDPEVVKVAQRYFGLTKDPRLRIFIQDGRTFIEKTAREIAVGRSEPYDMVIIDVYNSSTIPYHLTTKEFTQAVRRTLSPNGVMVFNIIGAFAGPSSQLLRSMTRTVSTVFPQVYLFPILAWQGKNDHSQNNVILVATVDTKYWDASIWQAKANSLYQAGVIKENVPEYVKTLVARIWVRDKSWFTKVPLLTDDYAPVDTLKSPFK